MDDTLKKMVRIGKVSTINTDKKTARVIYEDMDDLVSGWLSVLQFSGSWMPKVNDMVLVLYLPVFNGDGFILGVIP